jgi:hypothetical protein
MSDDVRKVATYLDMSQQFIDALPKTDFERLDSLLASDDELLAIAGGADDDPGRTHFYGDGCDHEHGRAQPDIAGALADGGSFADVDPGFADWVHKEIGRRHGGTPT